MQSIYYALDQKTIYLVYSMFESLSVSSLTAAVAEIKAVFLLSEKAADALIFYKCDSGKHKGYYYVTFDYDLSQEWKHSNDRYTEDCGNIHYRGQQIQVFPNMQHLDLM